MFAFLTSLSEKYLKEKQYRKILFVLMCSFSVLAYYTLAETWEGNDLGRYLLSMNTYREMGLYRVLTEGLWKNTPLASIEMYFFSLLGDNHLLPAFNAIVIWSIYFYILIKEIVCDGYVKCRNAFFCLAVIVSYVNLFESISNVRYPLAAALFTLGIYLDCKKGKKIWGIILYTAACLIHVGIIPLLVVRIMLTFKFLRNNRWLLIVLVALSFGFLSRFLLSSNNTFLNYLGEKTEMYSGVINSYGLLFSFGALCRYIGPLILELSCNTSEGDALEGASSEERYQKLYDEVNKGVAVFGLSLLFLLPSFSYRMTPIIAVGALSRIKYAHNTLLYYVGIAIMSLGIIISFYYNLKNYYIVWPFFN